MKAFTPEKNAQDRIAIIPARGGSKRIPRKNIIEFCGKPLLAWTIEAALESRCFSQVVVSTDDTDIAQEAMRWGASVPFLRTEYADDHTPVSEATLSCLRQAEQHWTRDFATVVQLLPSCPLRTAEDIRQALSVFDTRHKRLQVSCFRFGWMNPWWAAKLDADGRPQRMFKESAYARSQDLDTLFCPTGAIWIAQAQALKTERSFYGEGHVFEPMHWTSSVDIDDEEDLEMAKAVWIMRHYGQLKYA